MAGAQEYASFALYVCRVMQVHEAAHIRQRDIAATWGA